VSDRDRYVDKSAPPRARTAVPAEVEDAPTSPIVRENKPLPERVERLEARADEADRRHAEHAKAIADQGAKLGQQGEKLAAADASFVLILKRLDDAALEREVRRQRELAAAEERKVILDQKERRWTAMIPQIVPIIAAVAAAIAAITVAVRSPAPAVALPPAPVAAPIPIGGMR
jgi:hypothetical protein